MYVFICLKISASKTLLMVHNIDVTHRFWSISTYITSDKRELGLVLTTVMLRGRKGAVSFWIYFWRWDLGRHLHSYPWFSILHSESVGQGASSHHLTSSQRRPAVLGGQVQVKSSHMEKHIPPFRQGFLWGRESDTGDYFHLMHHNVWCPI